MLTERKGFSIGFIPRSKLLDGFAAKLGPKKSILKPLTSLAAYVIGVLILWAVILVLGYFRVGTTPGYPTFHVLVGFQPGMLGMYLATRVHPSQAEKPRHRTLTSRADRHRSQRCSRSCHSGEGKRREALGNAARRFCAPTPRCVCRSLIYPSPILDHAPHPDQDDFARRIPKSDKKRLRLLSLYKQ